MRNPECACQWLIKTEGGEVIGLCAAHAHYMREKMATEDHAGVPMILTCPNPKCCARHIDEGEFASKPHHTHACQECGLVWRPAKVNTVGVRFLPGYKSP